MNKRYRVWGILGLGWLLGAGWLVSAESAIYRWVDQQGRVQFGDRPPSDQVVREIPLKDLSAGKGGSVSAPDQQRRETRQRMLDAYREEREQKRQAREKQAAEAVKRKRRCVEAKNRAQEYERSAALYRERPDGSRAYLSKKQFTATLEAARDTVKRWCSGRD